MKAAYTYSKAMNRQDDDGWATVDWNDPSLLYKNYGPAGYDRTHVFQLGLPGRAAVREERLGRRQRDRQELVAERRLQRLHRDAVHRHRLRRLAQRAGQPQYADLVGTANKTGDIGSDTPYYDTSAWAPVTEVRPAPRAATPCAARAGGTSTCRSSAGSRSGRSSPCEARVEAFNLTNTPHFTNPNGSVNSGGFMTITGTSGNSPERQFRLGLRMQF